MRLPEPYSKEANPFEHFDHPEALARDRIRSDIASGWAHHEQVCAYSGWYGHATEVIHDELHVLECAGIEMDVVFAYAKLLRQVEIEMTTTPLFAI